MAPPSLQAELLKAGAAQPAPVPAQASCAADLNLSASGQPSDHCPESQPAASGMGVEPKDKNESDEAGAAKMEAEEAAAGPSRAARAN